jgi:hypothetical protein
MKKESKMNTYSIVTSMDSGSIDGNTLTTYAIECKETGEVRLLEDCVTLEMELFSEEDWDALLED